MLYIFLFSVCFLFLQVAFFLLTHFMCLQNHTHVCKINPRACERIFISLTQYEFRFIFRCAAVPYEDSEKSSLTFILSVCPAEPQLLFRDFKGNARFRLRLKRHPADSLKLLCRTHDARSDIMDIHLNHFRCRIFLRSDC